jgi:hypothetical protein
MMTLANRAGLPAARLAALEAELPAQTTLSDVVLWSATHAPALLVADVIAMDEYTHDVVVPWREGLVLVYDTT